METPKIIQKQLERLNELLEQDERPDIKAKDVAELLGIDVECLRMLAEKGQLPFGFGGRESYAANRVTKISKLALYLWITQGGKIDCL